MNIVYASNERYARHLGVSLYSLLDRNQDVEKITVYLLSVEMSRECKEKLKVITDRFHRELAVIELGDLRQKFAYQVNTGGFDISTLSRLFIGEVLPEQVERVIYMDCDTVILQSLKKMWETDLKGKVIGAVMEPTIYPSIKAQIGLTPEQPYYNAGVLLIDLKKWRACHVQKQLLNFYESMGGHLFACDQDTINGALKGKIKTLSPRYNFFTNYRYFHYKELVRLSPAYGVIPRVELKQAKRHPVVLHFMGDERPWKNGNYNHYKRAYEWYLEQTPWRGESKEKGTELYMLAYHAMNYLTFLCPASRRLISQRFGMKMIDARQKQKSS